MKSSRENDFERWLTNINSPDLREGAVRQVPVALAHTMIGDHHVVDKVREDPSAE